MGLSVGNHLDTGWRRYQRDAARVFRAMGFEASIDTPVQGARSTHMVDVWVRGSVKGMPWSCVVECKDWKRKVGKAEILALKAICDDVGASAGTLIAESGFQPGARSAASRTMLRLTTLDELAAQAGVRLPEAGKCWNELVTFVEARLGPLASVSDLPASKRLSLSTDDARRLQRLLITAVEQTEQELRARIAEGRHFGRTADRDENDTAETPLILAGPVEMNSSVDDEGFIIHAGMIRGFLELLEHLARWRREVIDEDIMLVPLELRSEDDTYPDGFRAHTWVDLGWAAELVSNRAS